MSGVRALLALSAVLMLCPVAVSDHIQADATRSILFDHRAGNEWWVEVMLGGRDASTVSKVEAMDDGGAWTPLTKRSWGAWAASFHIEPGHKVLFRASWPDGSQRTSCWFEHPSGAERCDTPPTSGFDASFTGVRGNEWWVQGWVAANGPVSKVDVRLNGGAWMPLSKQSWGGWAASYHIVQGTVVQLRATTTDGASDLSSCRQWIPPANQDAAIVPCPGTQPPAFDATFSNVKGNEWWVEAKVTANQPIAAVHARLGCSGPWNPLTLRSWGAWAASFRIPPGTHVDLRATSSSGATDVSGAYVWPQATPTDSCDHPWPRASSYADVRFRDELRSFDEGGERYFLADGLVHAHWTGTAWDGTCEQRVTRMDTSGTWSNVTEQYPWDRAPPKGELPATVGGAADLQTVVNGCRLAALPDQPVVGRETRAFSVRTSSGDPVPIDAYHANESDIGFFHDSWWDARHGLMLDWDQHSSGPHHSSNHEGWLLSTDATFG